MKTDCIYFRDQATIKKTSGCNCGGRNISVSYKTIVTCVLFGKLDPQVCDFCKKYKPDPAKQIPPK